MPGPLSPKIRIPRGAIEEIIPQETMFNPRCKGSKGTSYVAVQKSVQRGRNSMCKGLEQGKSFILLRNRKVASLLCFHDFSYFISPSSLFVSVRAFYNGPWPLVFSELLP